MKRVCAFIGLVAIGVSLAGQLARSEEPFPRWAARMDLGGTIPQEADLTELGSPVSGEKFKLDPGFQFDISGGYRPTPWLEVGPELGFTFNSVDSIGGWSYHETMLGQILMMANVRLEYPVKSRVAPFIGAGIGAWPAS
jgi:Outer membrane protein beta-barrel domain